MMPRAQGLVLGSPLHTCRTRLPPPAGGAVQARGRPPVAVSQAQPPPTPKRGRILAPNTAAVQATGPAAEPPIMYHRSNTPVGRAHREGGCHQPRLPPASSGPRPSSTPCRMARPVAALASVVSSAGGPAAPAHRPEAPGSERKPQGLQDQTRPTPGAQRSQSTPSGGQLPDRQQPELPTFPFGHQARRSGCCQPEAVVEANKRAARPDVAGRVGAHQETTRCSGSRSGREGPPLRP